MSSPFSPHETLTRSLQIYLSNNNSNSDNTQVRLADLDNCLLFLNDTNHHNATSQVTYQHAYPNQQLNHYNNMEVELLHCIFTYFKKDGTKSLKQLKEHFLFVSAPNDTTASVFHITFPNKHKEKDLYIRLLSKLRVFAFVPVFKCFLAHPNGRALDPVILTANQQEYILLHGEGAALVITTSVTVRDGAKSVVAELFLQKMMENGHNDGKGLFQFIYCKSPYPPFDIDLPTRKATSGAVTYWCSFHLHAQKIPSLLKKDEPANAQLVHFVEKMVNFRISILNFCRLYMISLDNKLRTIIATEFKEEVNNNEDLPDFGHVTIQL